MKTIPFKIHGGFWLVAALIGFLNSHSFPGTLIWMFVILISIMVHEYGHAIAARLFGLHPRIELVAFGGATIYQPVGLAKWKEFTIILMGPLFGFGLFVAAFCLLKYISWHNPYLIATLRIFTWVNLFWTLLNLLPIFPLDGGQLVRVLCEKLFRERGLRIALAISIFFGILCTLAAFVAGFYFVGAILILMVFQNYEVFKMSKNVTDFDKMPSLQNRLEEGKQAYLQGDLALARTKLEAFCNDARRGALYLEAVELLAKIYHDTGEFEEAYEILSKVEKKLSEPGKVLFFYVSYAQKDYRKAALLAGPAFQATRQSNVALFAARSHALLKETDEAVHWLDTLKRHFQIDVAKIVEGSDFDGIRTEKKFRNFLFSDDYKSRD